MKKSLIKLLLLGFFMQNSINAQIPFQNNGFELNYCSSYSCNFQSQSMAVFNNCLNQSAQVGWHSGSYFPIHQRNDCDPAYDASEGSFCVELGATSAGDGDIASIYYQFPNTVIAPLSQYELSLDYISIFSQVVSEYYLYVIGSNELVNNSGPLVLEDVLVNGTILSTQTINFGQPNWNTLSLTLTNATSTPYSQILFIPTKHPLVGIANNDPINRDAPGPDVIMAIDNVSDLTLLGEYCCLIPILTLECTRNREMEESSRKVCATIELFSPCTGTFLPEELYTIEYAENILGNPYCKSSPEDVPAVLNLLSGQYCFEESYFNYTNGSVAIFDFQLPDTSFCTECEDLSVSFIDNITVVDCNPLFPPNQMNPDAIEYSFTNTSTYGDETPVLFLWEFTLTNGTVITSTLENPEFYVARYISSIRDCENYLQSEFLPFPISYATLTIYTANGCKQTYTTVIYSFSAMAEDQFISIEPRSTIDANLTVNLAPNPAKDLLYITIDTQIKAVLSAKIFGIQGGLIHDYGELNFAKGKSTEKLDISDIPPGFFILDIRDSGFRSTIPFTIIK